MTGFTVALCIILVIMIACIIEKNDELKLLRKKVWDYESRDKGIATREKEAEITISSKLKAADKEIEEKKREIAHEQLILEHKAKMIEYDRNNIDKELSRKRKELDKELSKKQEAVERELNDRISIIEKKEISIKILQQNLVALPYMASIVADFDTRGLELLAQKLDWGSSVERAKKVVSIRELRRNTRETLAKYKEAQYQLDYALKMFPALSDFLETDYRQLPVMDISNLSDEEHDTVRDYLTREEFNRLSVTERNQLALDRYRESRRKTNWQIGRDYELYVGYKYTQKGYEVDYFGSYMGLEDLGRDLIAKMGNNILIIQCKYWSSKKLIHENHINQLYGTMVCYCLEHNTPMENVQGVIVTNITLSETAKRFANYLGISYVESFPLGNYPCIKCNINRSQFGDVTKIYHLPFDQQYDSCKINSPGEFYAMTVAEAEAAGFRRAFRWHGNNG